MAEPRTQVEIQLGHMCNNRCVFCVSGQETGFGRARPLPVQPILDRVSEAFEKGHRKLTLLGGEPTLQPGFQEVVRHAVALGFQEIVLFTNGVKTARASFIDEIVALGGNLTWRISIQGANKRDHERTTRKPGSFDRIVDSMGHLKARGQRLTVNMCVVQSNYESVAEFPELLARFGAVQLHLDMVRPLDAGVRTEEEFTAMIPRYSDLAGPLRRMVQGFPRGFDVNIGNLPYCIAPDLAPYIHHDGESTETVAVDGGATLSRPWDKYFVKRRDKHKPESCAQCVFESKCSGVFEKYEQLYGLSELVPVSVEALRAADPERRLLALQLAEVVTAAEQWQPPAPFDRISGQVASDVAVRLTLHAGERRVSVLLREPGLGAGSFTDLSVHPEQLPKDRALALAGLRTLWAFLAEGARKVLHPLADDCLEGNVKRTIAARLGRLRQKAPFGTLSWTSMDVSAGGSRAELHFAGPAGERATLWLAETDGKPSGGYTVDGEATPAVVDGLRAAVAAMKSGVVEATRVAVGGATTEAEARRV